MYFVRAVLIYDPGTGADFLTVIVISQTLTIKFNDENQTSCKMVRNIFCYAASLNKNTIS